MFFGTNCSGQTRKEKSLFEEMPVTSSVWIGDGRESNKISIQWYRCDFNRVSEVISTA